MLNPVTIPHPSSLVAISSRNALNQNVPNVSWPRYREIRAHAKSFASLGITAFDSFTLSGNAEPEQLNGQRVDASFLPTLGVLPVRGRNFIAEEDVPNGPAVCIISHELWQTRFGGRQGIVGERITLNGQPWEIVGVMPPHLSPPYGQVHVFVPRVFEVGGLTPAQVEAGSLYAQPIARLKDGVSIEQAAAELAAIGRSYRAQFGARLDANAPNELQTFVASLVGGIAPTFYMLLAAVAMVLLIACANVASLFLGRLAGRRREIAVRQSLGAERKQIVMQFMTESLLFSAAAGAIGGLVAVWVVQGIQRMLANLLPPGTTLTLNWRALQFTVLITLVAAVFVGLAPASQGSKEHLVDVLKEGARGSTRRGGRFRSALIISEVTLSVILLVGSALLFLSFVKAYQTSPGFVAKGVASAIVTLPATRYGTAAQQTMFFNRVIEELRGRPEVDAAAVSIGLPMSGFAPRSPYGVGGQPVLPLPQRPLAGLSIVSDSYFTLLGVTFVEGRAFRADDTATAPKVCIINESLARRLFPGQSALGQIILRGRNNEIQNEIVGVIHDVKTNGVNAPTPDEIYHPIAQLPRPAMAIVAKTSDDPAALQSVINDAVRRVDKDQPTTFFATLESSVASSLGPQRTVASLTSVFAIIALSLAAVGLYSLLAYLVAQRTSEIGIRMALGAQQSQVVGLVMRSGFELMAIGLGLGLAGAAVGPRVIQSQLFHVQPLDARIYAAVAALFVVVAAFACLLPSVRASRVDPVIALQEN